MIGADIENGLWAILGARQGLYKTMCTDWNYVNVRDFQYLNNLWFTEYEKLSLTQVENQVHIIGTQLIKELNLPIAVEPLNSKQSKFFKTIYRNPDRISRAVIDPE